MPLSDSTTLTPTRSQGLVDVLDRILDKGLVIAGDVRVNLANVELLTIHVRLLVCSIDKAEQIGLTWWKTDPMLSGNVVPAVLERENEQLRERVRALEESVASLRSAAIADATGRSTRRGGRTKPDED